MNLDDIVADNNLSEITSGSINSSSGGSIGSTTRMRSTEKIYLRLGGFVQCPGYKFACYRYTSNADSGNFDRVTDSLAVHATGCYLAPGWYRFVFATTTDATVTDEIINAVEVP